MNLVARLRPGSRTITCPFCFTSFAGREVHFRCRAAGCPGEAPDPVYADAMGRVAVPMGHVSSADGHGWLAASLPLAAPCRACSRQTRTRLCPHCHFELSHDAGQVEDKVIAIIGGRNTGKSHYIVSLIERLEHEVGTNFGFGVRMLGDATRARFEQDFRTPLLRNKTILTATQPAAVNVTVKMPMVFRLTMKARGGRRALNLSFFDTAGEDMKSLETMTSEARYICSAAGIIFLLDPLQVDAVRQRLRDTRVSLPAQDPLSEPTYIVERLQELFERQPGATPGVKVRVPVAFALSKVDALEPLLDPGSDLRRPGEHFGALDLADVRSVHTEIWSHLQTWMGPGFSSRVQEGFSSFSFFGVSALGEEPVDGRVESVAPLRVEDPLLWILHRLGLVRGRDRKGA